MWLEIEGTPTRIGPCVRVDEEGLKGKRLGENKKKINTFIHPDPLKRHKRFHKLTHASTSRLGTTAKKVTQRAICALQAALSSVTQAGLTIPAGLDTKINKHIGFWGQISRLILEIWYERLTEKHTVESQSTGCHHFRWSGVKKSSTFTIHCLKTMFHSLPSRSKTGATAKQL